MVLHLSASHIQRGDRRLGGDYANEFFSNTFLVPRRDAEHLDRYRYCKSHLDTDWSVVMVRSNENVEMDAEYFLDRPACRSLCKRLEVAPTNNLDLLTRWTRLEALAKLTDTPVIVLLKSQLIVNEESLAELSVSRSMTIKGELNGPGAVDGNATYSFATTQLSLGRDDRFSSIICSVCTI